MERYPLIKNLSEKIKKTDEDDDDETDNKPLILPKISRPTNREKTKITPGDINQPNKFLEWLRGGNQKETNQDSNNDKPGEFILNLDNATPKGENTLPAGTAEVTGLDVNNSNEIEPSELPIAHAWIENDWIRLLERTKTDGTEPYRNDSPVNKLANEISWPQSYQQEQNLDTKEPGEQVNFEYAESGVSGNDDGGKGNGSSREYMPADNNRRKLPEIHNIDPYLTVKLAQQEAVNDAAYIGEKRGLRRGLITGLLTGWYIERRHRKRVEKHMGKRLDEQHEAIEQLKKSVPRPEINKYAVAEKFERLGQERRKIVSEKFRPRRGKEKLILKQKRNAITEKSIDDSLIERPIATGHRLESSAWHSIEIDSKSGRAVASPEIPYGKEFLHEQKQEKATPLYHFGLTTKTATGYAGHVGKTALASTNKDLQVMVNNVSTFDVKTATANAHLTGGRVTDLINARPIIWGLVAAVVIVILLLFFR